MKLFNNFRKLLIDWAVRKTMSAEKPIALKLGNKAIRNLNAIKSTEIDIDAIDIRLSEIHRFSGNPEALTVLQHTFLVQELILHFHKDHLELVSLLWWARHHDDAEAYTGDIPNPIKKIIKSVSNILKIIEENLNEAILEAYRDHGKIPYSLEITEEVEELVDRCDKIALAMERYRILGWKMSKNIDTEGTREKELMESVSDFSIISEEAMELIFITAIGKADLYLRDVKRKLKGAE